MRKLICVWASFVTVCVLATPICAQSGQTNNREVITKARSAYYNLRNHGFSGFTATIEPNWKVTLGPTATKENLKVFRALRFLMAVNADGTVRVTHAVAD